MKTKILLSIALLAAQITSAQVLYSENFDNLTVGNVGTDFTGATAGQGNWYTLSQSSEIPSENSNSYFKVVTEPGRGNVLELATTPGKGQTFLQKRDIDALWNNRNTGNNILKIEIDFYTGDQFSDGGTGFATQGGLVAIKTNYVFDATSNDVTGLFNYYTDKEFFSIYTAANSCPILPTSQTSYSLKLNTWIKISYYLDFQNQKIYFVIPAINFHAECILNPNITIKSLLLKNSNWIGNQAIIPKHKYDNLVISAVNKAPLNNQEFISDKFNLYPNPSNEIITISSNEIIDIYEVKMFDLSGKLIKTFDYNGESNLQIDISKFATGTYLFYIFTQNGIAVKKIIKK